MLDRKTTCFDPRYDKKNILDMSIEQLQQGRLRLSLKEDLLKNKANIKAKDLKGKFLILKEFLPEECINQLQASLIARYNFLYKK